MPRQETSVIQLNDVSPSGEESHQLGASCSLSSTAGRPLRAADETLWANWESPRVAMTDWFGGFKLVCTCNPGGSSGAHASKR